MNSANLHSAIQEKIYLYQNTHSIYSMVFQSVTITLLINHLRSNNTITPQAIYSYLQHHQWNTNKQTATDICVAGSILACFKEDNINDQSNVSDETTITDERGLKFIKILAHFKLLDNFDLAKQCFNKISKVDNIKHEYFRINYIQALDQLYTFGLLNGDHALTNFDAITQNGGEYAQSIAEAFIALHESELLNQENRNAITQNGGEYAQSIAEAFIALHESELLNQENRNAITQNGGKYAFYIAKALKVLRDSELLKDAQAQANCNAIIQNGGEYAPSIAEALNILDSTVLLKSAEAQANFNAIIQNDGQYAKSIANALQILQDSRLLKGPHAQAYFNAIIKYGGQYAEDIAAGLDKISELGLLSGDHAEVYRDAITQNGGQYVEDMTIALEILYYSKLLNGAQAQANRNAITQYDGQYAKHIAIALQFLQYSELLKGAHAQTNRDAITKHGRQNVESTAKALEILYYSKLLRGNQAQANFDLIINYTKHATEHHHGIEFLVQKIEQLNQQNQLTQTNYRSLFILPEDYTKTIKSDHSDIDKTKAETTVVTDYYRIIQLLFPELLSKNSTNTFNINNTDPMFILVDALHFSEYVTTYLKNKADEIPGYILKNTPILLTSFNLIFKALTLYDDKTMLKSCIDIISFLLDHSSEIKDNIILLAAASIDSYDEFYSECDQFIMTAKIKFATKAVETKDKITIPYQSNFFSFPDNGNSQLSNKSNTTSTINN